MYGTSLSTSEPNRRTAKPERRPEGKDVSEVLCGAYRPFHYARALFFAWLGVLELDLT